MGAIEIFPVDEAFGDFFAPVSTDLISSLVAQYVGTRQRIDQIAETVTGEVAGAMHYFLEGNGRDNRYGTPAVAQLFAKDGAIAALNSAYWSKAMQLTDVLNYMPQARRDEWNKSITEKTCPEFEEETVRNTLTGLLNMRSQFLAERVDGIFRGLSGEHVTNSPAAFGKRMIVGYVLNEYWHSTSSKCGLINDLRCVIAKFMGRDEPNCRASEGLINTLKGRWGEWVTVDGGALKIRLYKKGTAHIEVHPDMAWRLNATLAAMYPLAIPPEFRTKPKRKAKEIQLIQRPLPFAVIDILAQMKQATRTIKQDNFRHPFRYEKVANALKYDHYEADKHAVSEAATVLESIGGVRTTEGWWQFDYTPGEVIAGIVASGCIPDDKAHQFYPTPEALATRAVELAQIGPDDVCLEPSAGTAGLADLMPKDRTRCIEVSELRCSILSAKGFTMVSCADFLTLPAQQRYDRVVMNPPFDRGQWQAHVEHAAASLKPYGRLVAILPSSAKSKDVLPGWKCEWHGPFNNQFPGASVSVVILVAERSGQ